MRSLFALSLLALLGSALPAGAAPLDVVRIWPAFRTTESFDRIGTYFNGDESSADGIIRRSQPTAREGYYFLVRLKNPAAAVPGATFELQVITPASPEPRIFAFKADVPAGTQAFNLGLTGADWPGAKTRAVAWLLTVRAPGGAELARQQSFLWAAPAATP
jgi:hypothetical protein